jgi:hypothetical protein
VNLLEEQVCFYGELGLCITNWAHVEERLRKIVLASLVIDDHNVISVGFFSIENFRSKLEFVDKVVERRFAGQTVLHDWPKLVDRARRASFLRNKLAHRRVRRIEKSKAGRRYALEAWINKKSDLAASKDKPLPGALCLRDIVSIRFEFVSLCHTLDNFCARLAGHPEPRPKSDEQPQRPPTIRQLKHLILGDGVHLVPHDERGAKPKDEQA